MITWLKAWIKQEENQVLVVALTAVVFLIACMILRSCMGMPE